MSMDYMDYNALQSFKFRIEVAHLGAYLVIVYKIRHVRLRRLSIFLYMAALNPDKCSSPRRVCIITA